MHKATNPWPATCIFIAFFGALEACKAQASERISSTATQNLQVTSCFFPPCQLLSSFLQRAASAHEENRQSTLTTVHETIWAGILSVEHASTVVATYQDAVTGRYKQQMDIASQYSELEQLLFLLTAATEKMKLSLELGLQPHAQPFQGVPSVNDELAVLEAMIQQHAAKRAVRQAETARAASAASGSPDGSHEVLLERSVRKPSQRLSAGDPRAVVEEEEGEEHRESGEQLQHGGQGPQEDYLYEGYAAEAGLSAEVVEEEAGADGEAEMQQEVEASRFSGSKRTREQAVPEEGTDE